MNTKRFQRKNHTTREKNYMQIISTKKDTALRRGTS